MSHRIVIARAAILAGIAVTAITAQTPAPSHSARYRAGRIPAQPALVVGGGQVILEASVSRTGQVDSIARLRTTAPFTEFVEDAVRQWVFAPAAVLEASPRFRGQVSQTPVDSRVVVVAVYRPPALNGPTLGEPPVDVATATDDCAYPLTLTEPPFPPLAASGGVVLVEALVDQDGAVAETTVIHSTPPFDAPAVATLGKWRFRPARVHGARVPAFVYVLFGFPMPVTTLANNSAAGARSVR